eukprot:11153773-Alexandrium_andersonii.AAC.1
MIHSFETVHGFEAPPAPLGFGASDDEEPEEAAAEPTPAEYSQELADFLIDLKTKGKLSAKD